MDIAALRGRFFGLSTFYLTFDFLLSTKNLRFSLHISKKSSTFAPKL